ncbi:MAG: hypothetical protein GTN40_03185 [Candidatus Aenigmarchaeota archaeon]|nr:hypothetical protein [Candidatus Aenigmarchaeota archaeon]
MKIQILTLILIMLLALPVVADELTIPKEAKGSRIEIYTDEESYYSGERGIIIAEIETFGEMQEAEIEIEILSPEGKLVYGDLLYTEIPRKTVLNAETEQTEQVIYHEDIGYMSPQKTIRRVIDFEVPIDAVTGTYTLNVNLRSPDITFGKSEFLYISGSGETIDFIILIYIVILIFSLYLIWRG